MLSAILIRLAYPAALYVHAIYFTHKSYAVAALALGNTGPTFAGGGWTLTITLLSAIVCAVLLLLIWDPDDVVKHHEPRETPILYRLIKQPMTVLITLAYIYIIVHFGLVTVGNLIMMFANPGDASILLLSYAIMLIPPFYTLRA